MARAWTLLQTPIDSDGKLPPRETFEVASSADRRLTAFGPWPVDLWK